MRALRALTVLVALAAATVAVAPDARASDLDDARRRANEAAAALNEAESEAAELEGEVADAQRRLEDAQAGMAGMRELLRQTAIDSYVGAAATPDEQLMLGTDINRQVQAQALVELVTQGSADTIDQYRVLAEDAEAAQAELDATLGAQRAAVERLGERQRAMTAELSRLEELERQRLAAEEAARQAAARAAAQASRSSSSGASRAAPATPIVVGNGFICPVQGPVSFVDSWGAPRSGGRRHQGVDMMSPEGTPTVAPVSGTVTHRGNSLGGLSWYVNGDDGNLYYGTHLSAYANEGAGHVQAGTVIGYVGHSGNASVTAPHLHFEIRPGGGAAVNPTPTVRAAC